MIYGISRLMNNWQVENSSCLWKRNHQRSGKRNRRSRQRKPHKTKEKEKLHLFPQRLYSKALILNRLHVFILLLMNFRSNGFSWCFQHRNPGFESLLHYFKCIKKLSPFYWHFETNSLLNFLSQWLFMNFDLTNLRNQERWIQNLRMIIKIWQPWPCLWR